MSSFSSMCPQQNRVLLKESFITGSLKAVLQSIFLIFYGMNKDSDKQVFYSTAQKTDSLWFSRCSALLSKYSHLSVGPCASLSDCCSCSPSCDASPASFLSSCLIGLIGDGGGCCPERQTYRQPGVPCQSPPGGPSRLVPQSSWAQTSQASGVSGDQLSSAVTV